MGLADYQPERREHALKGGSVISVTGLSLQHVAHLVNHHFNDIGPLFDLFTNLERVHGDNLVPILSGLIKEAPGFVANAIALAAGEPNEARKAEALPFTVQIAIISDIVDLTFRDAGGVGNAIGMLVTMIENSGLNKKVSPSIP